MVSAVRRLDVAIDDGAGDHQETPSFLEKHPKKPDRSMEPSEARDRGASFDRVAGTAAKLLLGSPFRDPRRWSLAVVVLENDGDAVRARVTSRGDHAGWLRSNALEPMAHECLTRRVPAGCVLVWASVDLEAGADVRFVAFDIATGRHR